MGGPSLPSASLLLGALLLAAGVGDAAGSGPAAPPSIYYRSVATVERLAGHRGPGHTSSGTRAT